MAKFTPDSDDPRLGDLKRWSIAALVCSSLAVVSANIAGFVPAHAIGALHATRVEGGSVSQMRRLLAELQADNARLASEHRRLTVRLGLLDGDKGEMVRRLAAVEQSLPLLIESLPHDADIDRSLLTASISPAEEIALEADGGSVLIRQRPLFDGGMESQAIAAQPMPPALAAPVVGEPGLAAQGIAVGGAIDAQAMDAHYREIIEEAGTLLLGLTPLIADDEDPELSRFLFGPLPDEAAADMVCGRLATLGLVCDPVAYDGVPWPI